MIFFTRALFEAAQHDDESGERAAREWERRLAAYGKYADAIGPMLPETMRALGAAQLHDGVVRRVACTKTLLRLEIDARRALGGYRGQIVRLTFRGLKKKIAVKKLVKQWWLYQESHLRPDGRFELRLMFDKTDLAIEANALEIAVRPAPVARARSKTPNAN